LHVVRQCLSRSRAELVDLRLSHGHWTEYVAQAERLLATGRRLQERGRGLKIRPWVKWKGSYKTFCVALIGNLVGIINAAVAFLLMYVIHDPDRASYAYYRIWITITLSSWVALLVSVPASWMSYRWACVTIGKEICDSASKYIGRLKSIEPSSGVALSGKPSKPSLFIRLWRFAKALVVS
jgi:hypothetical protein